MVCLRVPRPYRSVFFDLDHTLWDFTRNSAETLSDLYDEFGLEARGVPSAEAFRQSFDDVNLEMWARYRAGELDAATLRRQRFHETLMVQGVDDFEMSVRIGDRYVHDSPRKRHLIDGALETLSALEPRFELHVITNGFDDIQAVKLEQSGLRPFFGEVITSERSGARKPAPEMFRFALEHTGASASTSLMIGDDLDVDIAGARAVAMDQVYFNPEAREHDHDVTFEVQTLGELGHLLGG